MSVDPRLHRFSIAANTGRSTVSTNTLFQPSESEIYATIARCCGLQPEACEATASIYQLGIDSLAMAALIAHFELHLSLDFQDSTLAQIMSAQTLGELVELVQCECRNATTLDG